MRPTRDKTRLSLRLAQIDFLSKITPIRILDVADGEGNEMSLKFELCVRDPASADGNLGKSYVPESHEYEMYLNALVDDLKSVPAVLAIQRRGNSIIVETRTPFEAKDLREEMKPYFSNGRFDQYRFVSLISIQ